MIQKLFEVLSERQGLKSEKSKSDFNQSRLNNYTLSKNSIEFSDEYDVPNAWEEVCDWYESFNGHNDDGTIVYYVAYSANCYWVYSWEATPGQTITIDAGGSSLGGGTYIPLRFEDHIHVSSHTCNN